MNLVENNLDQIIDNFVNGIPPCETCQSITGNCDCTTTTTTTPQPGTFSLFILTSENDSKNFS